MTPLQNIVRDKYLPWGWITILFSAGLFCLPFFSSVSPENYLAFFAVHFGLAILYHFTLLLNKGTRVEENMIHYRTIKLVLLLISAYALNREMDVFAASPTWFSVVLVVLCTAYLAGVYFQQLPRWGRFVLLFLYGVGLLVFGYLAIYLLPLYPISVPGLLVLGISLHSFVPLLFCLLTIFLLQRFARTEPRYWTGVVAGVVVTVVVCTGFVISWHNRLYQMNRQYTAAMAGGEDKLPLWVQVAQNTDRDAISQKILKTGLIYKIPEWTDAFGWNLPGRNFGEQQQLHDPLVTLANAFSGTVLMPEEDRIKVLESQYNARHEALERLWSGEALKTEQLTTTVKVWPHLRTAYTEKLLTVFNHQSTQRWIRQGEAIYTFHMPEGAVVTSLSLWVNGKEEKGILTSKELATNAYRTIVGYERRDPSVVHWQEGNTVTVRVFPVLAGSSRTFKIGITAPLRKNGDVVVYDNTWFDGPDASRAEETVKLEIAEGQQSQIQQASFAPGRGRTLTRTGEYQPRWTVSFKDKGIQDLPFSFNGYNYSLQPYVHQRVPVAITDVYLDINQSWPDDELQKLYDLVKEKRVWVYDGELQRVTGENRAELFGALKKKSFSLFPFHLVKDKAHAVVITHSGPYSPTISDLEGSPFLASLRAGVGANQRVNLFQLGTEMSPFLRSLKERRCFQFETGGLELLVRLLKNNEFVQDNEAANEIIIHSADAIITKELGEAPSSAPDHLMRLFAYNHIMQQLDKSETTAADSAAIIREAQQAYVVSPVSSLIVLETQQDYDRFGIKDNDNSLKNASLHNKGAVPEPGEWAIILLLAGAFLFFVYKTKVA